MKLLLGGADRHPDQDWVIGVPIPGIGPIPPWLARMLVDEGDTLFFIGLRSLLAAGVPRDGVHALAIGLVSRVGLAALGAMPEATAREAIAIARATYSRVKELEAEDAARRAKVPDLRIVR